MSRYVGLQNLSRDGYVPTWDDFTLIVDSFRLPEDETSMYAMPGLGRVVADICGDRSKSRDACTRLVAIELTKASNGMLLPRAYLQNNAFEPGAALRTHRRRCASGHPTACKPGYLPARVAVKLAYQSGYPYMYLGKWTDP